MPNPGKPEKEILDCGLRIADWRNRFALSFLLTSMAFLKYSIRLGHKSCANMMGFEQIGTKLPKMPKIKDVNHFIKKSSDFRVPQS